MKCLSVKQVLAPPRDARQLAKARRRAAPDTAGRCGVLGAGPSLFVRVAHVHLMYDTKCCEMSRTCGVRRDTLGKLM